MKKSLFAAAIAAFLLLSAGCDRKSGEIRGEMKKPPTTQPTPANTDGPIRLKCNQTMKAKSSLRVHCWFEGSDFDLQVLTQTAKELGLEWKVSDSNALQLDKADESGAYFIPKKPGRVYIDAIIGSVKYSAGILVTP